MPEHKINRIAGLEIAALIGLAVLIALPFTCHRRSQGDDKNVVRLWIHGAPEARDLMVQAAEQFNEVQDEVVVKIEDQSGGTGRWTQKYMSAMQSGSCADVLYMHWRRMTEFAAKRQLVPMDDLAERDAFDLNAFLPGALDAFSYRDNVYAMPVYGSTLVMFYNKDLFDKAGVEYPNDTWTWDDFLAAAKKLTVRDDQGRTLQIGCLPYDPSSWIWSAGGKFANADCSELYFEDPKTLEGLQFYLDLKNKHKVTSEALNTGGADPTAVNVFESGRVAMDITGPWKLRK